MILHDFPDLAWLKKQSEERFANKRTFDGTPLTQSGWPTVILNVKTKAIYRDNIRGPFSLFSNLSGATFVKVDGKRASIGQDYLFLTNADQYYTLEVDKNSQAETFNIHFGEKWMEEISTSLLEKQETQLDQPNHLTGKTIHFYNKLYRKDSFVVSIQEQLVDLYNQSALKTEELLYQLVTHLVEEQVLLHSLPAQLNSLKSSTRQEIIRRLFEATDYIYSFYHTSITLDELAKVSCLSKFHFLRLFKQVFGQTPAQFISHLRIEKGIELLCAENMDVKTISSRLGFDNPSSFSRLFYQKTGAYPTQFIKK